MNQFLSTVSGKLAERWVTTLVLPGVFFLLAVLCAVRLGHEQAFDIASVADWLAAHADSAPIALAAVAVLLGASATAIAAQSLGGLAEAIWTRPWRGPAAWIARPLVFLRGRRFDRAAARAEVDPVAVYRPRHPMWVGERFRLLDTRIAAQYHGLRLGPLWPRLWLLLPDTVRAPVQAAESRLVAARTLFGWGVLYLGLGAWWYPAAILGLVAAVLGWARTRAAVVAVTTWIEATVDTHLGMVCEALGHAVPESGITREFAALINDRLTKGD
ncbi:hypothetical protein [Actinoalloteichus hymeniacidonis]|uniref:Vegetative cell wall protein gp1 n=1 Tax=Actinoalloteichus hymeniacidonis TaxID=340345 RepID=A0AAC9MX38_9PSEU|nr:hypothetical protein [Actinoalloteichus hymeniacidonis]AOS61844.1 hypothetical protein TL08_05080 [Actinoalloteichus hymeniacidonis]MBB5910136.1 hypothetical protein [Actinoalloteichus hymeniacidonis]